MPVYRRGNTWWIRFQIGGKRYSFAAGAGATAEQAKALEAQARQDFIKGRLGQTVYTLEDAAARWLEGEAKSLQSYDKVINNIRIIRPYIQDTPIYKAPDAAQKIIEAFPNLSPATINRRLAIVRRLCNLAWEWQWVKYPVKISLLEGEKSRHVYLSIPQVIKLAKRARRTKWHVILAAFTGMRESEIFRLTKQDVEDDFLTIRQSKNGKPRVVPLNTPARCAINRLDWTVTYDVLRRDFELARGDADIRFHDLRHTAASFMVKGGASMVAIRDVLGHSNLGVTSRYSHLATSELKKAVDKMTNGTKMVQKPNSRKVKNG